MLKKLTVSNLAIVERAEVEFGPALNVITGETGAGKSVLMGALELVLGARADAAIVRDGAKEAEVEAVFDQFVIRRTLTREGRSRAWIDDESVTLAELRERTGNLVDIHGPRANQQILEEKFQRETLDAFGAAAGKTGEYAKVWTALTSLAKREAELLEGGNEDELELLRYQVSELEAANLSEEDETIAERHAAAAHAEELVQGANAITEALGGDESVVSILSRIAPELKSLARHFPEAGEWNAEIEALSVKAQELSRTVADAVSRQESDEENLESLDSRLTLVSRLKRKYGQTIAEILATLEAKREKLKAFEHRDEELAKVREELSIARSELKAAALALTKRRRAAADRLAKAVTRNLQSLGFLQAKFFVKLEPIEPEAHGADRIVYMFEPNPGEAARALSAIASSGEIARVMLALKGVLAEHDPVGLLVFDEIDANLGGEVGKVVGEKMRGVARHHQVVAITHLPQSAVYGERHLVVTKFVDNGRTRTKISAVSGSERIKEIARMLGGEKLTSVVRQHAEELLELSSRNR